MNSLNQNTARQNSILDCADISKIAERELTAFFRAVTESFGSEQATNAADAWLHELEKMNHLPASIRDWRRITAKVLTGLAHQLVPQPLSTDHNY